LQETIQDTLYRALDMCEVRTKPFRHWLIRGALPADTCAAIAGLPFAPPDIDDNEGRRDSFNEQRHFFSVANRARFPMCEQVAGLLQAPRTVRRIEALCGISLSGSFLRIEFCQDSGEFWLEPHTDIGAKLFTMQLHLNDDTSGTLGTDVYDRERKWVYRTPTGLGCGYIFVPGLDTVHGFEKRDIPGIRRTIIVNYVKDEWRSRHELAFPDQPVTS
jgi:hypothetical protein